MHIYHKNKGFNKGVAVGLGGGSCFRNCIFNVWSKCKKNQKIVSGWTLKMKAEIIEKLENLEEVTESIYNEIVDAVAARYEKAKDIDIDELKEAIKDIKKHWKVISSEATKK